MIKYKIPTEPDKVVSEVYEVVDDRVMKCMTKKCLFPTAAPNEDLCKYHGQWKCSVIWCTDMKDEGMPDRDDLCLTHYREYQLES